MVGGTFDPLHDGHKRLLDRSFSIAGPGGHVVIGLTTDTFARKKNHPIRPFQVRKEELEQLYYQKAVTGLLHDRTAE